MAINTLIRRRLVYIDTDYSAVDTAEVAAAIIASPGTYNDKVFILDDGSYVYVNSAGEIIPYADRLNAAKAVAKGPFDVTSGVVDKTESTDIHNYDPNGVGNVDEVSVLNIEVTVSVNITGIVPPTNGLSMLIYNKSSVNDLTIKNSSASSSPNNRFLINLDYTVSPLTGVWIFYDKSINKWRKI